MGQASEDLEVGSTSDVNTSFDLEDDKDSGLDRRS